MIKFLDIKKFIKLSIIALLALVLNVGFVEDSSAGPDGLGGSGWSSMGQNSGYSSSSTKSCYPGDKVRQVKSCTLCPLFVLVFNTVSKVGALSANSFTDGIIKVVIIGFAIWLAIETMKFVGSWKTKDLKDYVQAIITKGFIVLVVLMILKAGVGSFYNVFVQPVYNTAQTMSQIMFNSGTDKKEASNDASISGLKEITNGLPSSMGASIVKTMTMMENRVRQLNALGVAMLCQSWEDRWFIFPKAKYFIFGGAVWILTIAIIIMVPFIMIDSVFQLGVATALMPFAVGAYAFDYTKKMLCKKVWDTFLNSAFSFLFTSVIIIILLGAILTATKSGIGGIANYDEMFKIGSSAGYNTFAQFKDSVSWGSGAFLNLVFIFLLAWTVADMGISFAKKFATSMSETKIGSELGSAAGSLAQTAARKTMNPIGNAMKTGAKATASRIGRGVKHLGGRLATKRAQRKFDRQAQKMNVANAEGPVSIKVSKNKTLTKDENGNIIKTMNKEKVHKNGTKTIKENKEIRTPNVVIRIQTTTTKKMVNGKWETVDTKTVERMKVLSEKAEGLMNANGTCNYKAMEKLLEGTSGETKNIIRANAIRQITEARFSKVAFNPSSEKLSKPAETTIDAKGNIVTKYTTVSGEVIFTSTKMRPDGIIESTLSRVKKNGKVLTLQSDGIRQKMSVSLLDDKLKKERHNSLSDIKNIRDIKDYAKGKLAKDEYDLSGINNISDISDNCKKEKYTGADGEEHYRVIERVGYAYTDYYKEQLASGDINESQVPNGMFFHERSDGAVVDEYGEVVREASGKSAGGAFARYMRDSQSSKLFGEQDEKSNQSRNKYMAATESDMKYFFGNSKSRRVKDGLFGDIMGR